MCQFWPLLGKKSTQQVPEDLQKFHRIVDRTLVYRMFGLTFYRTSTDYSVNCSTYNVGRTFYRRLGKWGLIHPLSNHPSLLHTSSGRNIPKQVRAAYRVMRRDDCFTSIRRLTSHCRTGREGSAHTKNRNHDAQMACEYDESNNVVMPRILI